MSLASSGITVSAVKTALGSSNNNVGGLCTAANINPWSVWKPISLDAVTLTRTLLKNANYGLTMKYATTASGLLTAVLNNSNLGYVYNKPTGISTSPYRLGDFRNYNHSASIPLTAHYKDGDSQPINGVSSTYSITLQGIEPVLPDDLDSSDYLSKSHIYPSTVTNRGALVTNGTYTYWSVGSIPWGDVAWLRFKGSECTVLEFMTNIADGTKSTTYTTQSTDLFYALPEPLHTINVTNVSPSGSKTVFPVFQTCSFTDSTYSIMNYSFYLSAVGDVYAGGTLTNLTCGLCTDMDGVNIIAQKKLELSSINITSEGTSTTYSGTFANTGNSMIVYFCIWYNSKLQHILAVMLPAGDQLV